MKTAEYCVDYLSYQWQSTDDLITTYKEICKQRQKYVVNNATATTTFLLQKNQKKLKKSEEYKLKRFQNALWRTMAKNCTPHLGNSNQLINPATVSWQKESDITWLYGPMYHNLEEKSTSSSSKSVTQPSLLQGLKPVLKKQSNVTQLHFHTPTAERQQHQHQLPACSDDATHSLLLFYSSFVTAASDRQYHSNGLLSGGSSITTSASSSTRSSFSSVSSSSSSKIGVHFNPEIIEIEYQPEYPVSSPRPTLYDDDDDLIASNYSFYNTNEEESEEEAEDNDDAIWASLVDASKSFTYTQISILFSKCKTLYSHQQQQKTSQHNIPPSVSRKNRNTNNKYQLVYLMISMMKLTTTWLLYQSLPPLSLWLSLTEAKPVSDNTAGQSCSTTKATNKKLNNA